MKSKKEKPFLNQPLMPLLSLIFGKNHSGFVRGVVTGVILTRYWDMPRSKSSSKETIYVLQQKLQEQIYTDKDLRCQVEYLMSLAVPSIVNLADSPILTLHLQQRLLKKKKGKTIMWVNRHLKYPQVEHHESLNEGEETVTATCQEPQIRNSTGKGIATPQPKTLQQLNKTIKCPLSVGQRSNIVAKDLVTYSTHENQKIHGKPMTADYYRVYMDEAIKPSTCVPK
ncbi:unnamed protein product [Lactuca saligna]|uniref:Uncharacterized protein n=1 Tax=Lactuca saligna TaxID=75948 RepID=A0AA35YU66_LACSI|nr:unnamed protein product [Lactuca saligna]